MAEQPRIHDSMREISRHSDHPPPLSRYVRTDEPAETASHEVEQVAEAADAGPPRPPAGRGTNGKRGTATSPERPAAERASEARATPATVEAATPSPEQTPEAEPTAEALAEPITTAQTAPPAAPVSAPRLALRGAEPEVVTSLPPELADEHGSAEPQAALVSVQPEPAEAGRREKVPFWKRISLPRPIAQATQAATGRGQSLEPVMARLSALEKQLAANQSATETHLARFEENITRLWELEEQMTLTEVRERLALLEANQEEIADGLHAIGRNVSILAIVLAIGVAAALLGVGLAL